MKDTIIKLHERYANHIEDSYLIGSSDILLPFYRKQVDVTFIREEQLNLVEEYVGKCLASGISKITEIADVLSLSDLIMSSIIGGLLKQEFITYLEEEISVEFTKKGLAAFEAKIKYVDTEESFYVYFDGLTEKNQIKFIDNDKRLKNIEVSDSDVKVLGRNFPVYKPDDDYEPLKTLFIDYVNYKLGESDDSTIFNISPVVEIKSFSYQNNKDLFFFKYTMLVYADKNSNITALVYDPVVDRLVAALNKPVTEKLNEGYFEKFFDIDEALREAEIGQSKTYSLSDEAHRYIMTKEINDKFSYFLKNAQKSLYIISPWMNNYVVNDQFKNQLIELLKRNVEIRIIYGINSPHNSDERDVRTEKIAKELREIGKKYNNLLRLKHGHTHEKLLICDEKYYMNGSYNFLSYSPDGDGYFRNEGCTYIESEMTAKAATEERFNF